jgi:hypothetical protein
MTLSAEALWWCPVQITLLAVGALGIDAIIGRRRPAAGALVAAATLAAVVGLTASALAPWPAWAVRWDPLSWRHAAPPEKPAAGAPALDALRATSQIAADDRQVVLALAKPPANAAAQTGPFLQRAWEATAANWVVLVGCLYLVGVGVMAVRIGCWPSC